jgi:class 3 adenylate cyclase
MMHDVATADPPPDPFGTAGVELRNLLARLGGSPAEIDEAIGSGTGGALALELVLRAGRAPVPLATARAELADSGSDFDQFWQALGFTAADAETRVPRELVDTMPVVAAGVHELLGPAVALGLVRVIGSACARLAEALVDSFRTQYEVPELTAGANYVAVVERYVEITRDSLPALQDFIGAVLKAHLVRVAAGTWAPDDARQAASRDLFVCFVDLAGYTALTRTLTPGQLAGLVAEFEATVSEVVVAAGGRLVKLIGDGAMFVTDDVAAGCRAALQVSARLSATDRLPPARLGADRGPVLSLYGDYFGDVVNRAARLVALANPGTVVISETVAAAVPELAAERLPAQALKGFGAPAVPFRLRGQAETDAKT